MIEETASYEQANNMRHTVAIYRLTLIVWYVCNVGKRDNWRNIMIEPYSILWALLRRKSDQDTYGTTISSNVKNYAIVVV